MRLPQHQPPAVGTSRNSTPEPFPERRRGGAGSDDDEVPQFLASTEDSDPHPVAPARVRQRVDADGRLHSPSPPGSSNPTGSVLRRRRGDPLRRSGAGRSRRDRIHRGRFVAAASRPRVPRRPVGGPAGRRSLSLPATRPSTGSWPRARRAVANSSSDGAASKRTGVTSSLSGSATGPDSRTLRPCCRSTATATNLGRLLLVPSEQIEAGDVDRVLSAERLGDSRVATGHAPAPARPTLGAHRRTARSQSRRPRPQATPSGHQHDRLSISKSPVTQKEDIARLD